jgi:hypothetical protein
MSEPVAKPAESISAAPTATVTEAAATPIEPDEGADFSWVWLIVPILIVGAAAGWMASRKTKEL